ncbi:MAG: class II aldolase, partial [Pseudomonadota bacterium]
TPETQVVVLENHGLLCCGATVEEVGDLIAEVERRLAMPAREVTAEPEGVAPEGFGWAAESWIATDARASRLAVAGSYYPDHVVFLGPALPQADHAGAPPAVVHPGQGVALREGATSSQQAMLKCLSDVLLRLPEDWVPEAIGEAAEAELLNWDAEKYRQALAARQA